MSIDHMFYFENRTWSILQVNFAGFNLSSSTDGKNLDSCYSFYLRKFPLNPFKSKVFLEFQTFSSKDYSIFFSFWPTVLHYICHCFENVKAEQEKNVLPSSVSFESTSVIVKHCNGLYARDVTPQNWRYFDPSLYRLYRQNASMRSLKYQRLWTLNQVPYIKFN